MSKTKISKPHPYMHQSEKIRTSCPNLGTAEQVENEATPSVSLKTRTMRRRLTKVDFRPGSTMSSCADALGRIYRVDPGDLIQTAVARSLSPKTQRPDIPVEAFLINVMRSIGSSVARGRARSRERGVSIPIDLVREQIAAPKSLGTAFEMINIEADRHRFANLLNEAAGDEDILVGLIDGIGMKLCGAKLAERLGIEQRELATLRRRLKRRAQAIAIREGLIRVDKSAVLPS